MIQSKCKYWDKGGRGCKGVEHLQQGKKKFHICDAFGFKF